MNRKFAKDVEKGLHSIPKYLESKYFYNEAGDQLFQKIMELEEYYPTQCETEILVNHKELCRNFFQNSDSHFSLVELGAGDGLKTKILLHHFDQHQTNFSYLPIDISQNVLNILKSQVQKEIPGLRINPYHGDYFKALDQLNNREPGRKVILFLGSTIGNFVYDDAVTFLNELNKRMKEDDLLLIGFDLKKDPQVILNAYNDNKGITAAFNLNLLKRINHELGGDFKTEWFYHYPTYNPTTGEAQSYLVSKVDQTVHISALNQSFEFHIGEPIFMEVSKKYDLKTIEMLAEASHFTIEKYFFDNKKYFTNALWKKKK